VCMKYGGDTEEKFKMTHTEGLRIIAL